jgi:hypothetical protein
MWFLPWMCPSKEGAETMIDKCSNPNCMDGFIHERTEEHIKKPCHACNTPKSDGPYKFDEQKGGVLGPFGLEINTDDMAEDGNEVELLTTGFNAGRSSLIPLVRELAEVLKSCGYVLNGTGPQPPCTRCDDSVGYVCDVCSAGMDVISALVKAKKELEK